MPNNYNWYILDISTVQSFKSYYKKIVSIIPKGCAVLTLSKSKYNEYFNNQLSRSVLISNYIFILCDLDKHIKKIIKALNAIGIEAYLLTDYNNNPVIVPTEDIMRLRELEEQVKTEEEYKLGYKIRVKYGPMKGFISTISLITDKYIFCPIRLGKTITNIPLLRQDIELLQ